MYNTLKAHRLNIILAGVIVISLACYVWVLAPYGLEVANDSTFYVRGALNLHNHEGYTKCGQYINHYPIGLSYIYHLLLYVLPGTINQIAFWFHLVLLTFLGLGFISLMRFMRFSEMIQPILLWIFLLSVPLIDSATKLLTELPMLGIIMMSTLLLVKALKEPERSSRWLSIGIVWTIGYMIRFAALGFLGAFILLPFIIWPRQFNANLKRVVLMLLPFAITIICNKLLINWKYNTNPADRIIQWHPIDWERIIQFPTTLSTWLIDYEFLSLRLLTIATPILIISIVGLWVLKQHTPRVNVSENNLQKKAIQLFGIISIIYCLFLAVSISLFDAWTPINTRLLSPLAIYFFIGWGQLAHGFVVQSKRTVFSILLLVILSGIFTLSPAKRGIQHRIKPQGYATPYWNTTGCMIVFDSTGKWIDPTLGIYTNGVAFFTYKTNREIENMPFKFSPITLQPNEQWEEEMQVFRSSIENNQAQLVYFSSLPTPPHRVTLAEIEACFSDSSRFMITPFKEGFVVRKAQ